MWWGLSFLWVALRLPSAFSQAFLQEPSPNEKIKVPCSQTFEDFTKNFNVDCSSPCEVVCHAGCNQNYSASLITGYLYYTTSTPICYAALFQGATNMKTGGSFAIRSSGLMSGFVSGKSKVGEERSLSSDTPQSSWFIEPYERVRFIQEPVDTTVELGKYLTLTCKVNSRSGARVTWYNNGQKVRWSTTVNCSGKEVCMVQHAEKRDAGRWWCEVTTDYSGTLISRKVTVTVAYLNNTFIYQPHDARSAYAGYGGTLKMLSDSEWSRVMPCSVESQPPAQIVWYKNNRPLEERHVFQVNDGSLYFLTESEKDSGSYKCTAHNSVTNETITSSSKRIQKEAQATLPGPVPSSIISSISHSTVLATPGQTVSLTCVAKGNPIPTISWSVPTSVANSGRTSTPSFGRNYVVTDFRKSDEGEYRCNALNDNDYGMHSSFIIKVVMSTPPGFKILPNDQTHDPGEKVVLRCKVQGRGSLTWLKDGRPVSLSSNIKLKSEYLVIESVSAEDVGMYQCIATSYNGNKQSSAFLSVRSAPQITLANKDDLVHDAGLRVRIRCTATGFPYPYVSWYKEGQPLLFDDRIRMIDVQSIEIDRLDGLDYGDYTCVARNSLASVNLTRTLVVLVKANIQSLKASDVRGYYLSGDNILITCLAAGSKDLYVTWTKGDQDTGLGVTVSENNDVDLYDYVVKRSVLEIPVSSVENEGNYRCQARNYLGKSLRDIPIKVYPTAIPPLLESGPINTEINEQNKMLVKCRFSGAPPPWVTWRKDDEIIKSERVSVFYSEDGLVANLLISNPVKSDSGNYSCEGENSAGYTVRGKLPISIHYSDTGGVRNGTSSTRGLIFTLPVLFLWLLFV